MGNIYRFIHAPWLKPDEYSDASRRPSRGNPLKQQLQGDPIQGHELFAERACHTCHSVDGQRDLLGPDLAGAWAALGREGILKSLLEPDQSIKTGYETQEIETADGEFHTGRFHHATEDEISMMIAGNQVEIFPRGQITAIRSFTNSLMPSGLLDGLTDAQVNDLLGYLRSLEKPEPVIRLNAGGDGVIESTGLRWGSDVDYEPGAFGAMGGSAYQNHLLNDPLLQSCRYGEFEYHFEVDAGGYEITLIFAEPVFKQAGQRVFSVWLNGIYVIKDLDLLKEAGFGRPLRKQAHLEAENGRIELKFTALVNHALLSAIEVRSYNPLVRSPNP
jgi:putative heme-binding domain-containing protein